MCVSVRKEEKSFRCEISMNFLNLRIEKNKNSYNNEYEKKNHRFRPRVANFCQVYVFIYTYILNLCT